MNVINQGLYCLGWLTDHRDDFTIAVQQKPGAEAAGKIDWSGPRVLCIAGDFTRYDEYAVMQIQRNVELLRYRRYGGDLLLELVRASSAAPSQKRTHASETKEKQPAAGTANVFRCHVDVIDSTSCP